jgi:hypothetical protein
MILTIQKQKQNENGDIVDNWICDVDGSNESIEYIVELDGKFYSVITDMYENLRYPKRKAQEVI